MVMYEMLHDGDFYVYFNIRVKRRLLRVPDQVAIDAYLRQGSGSDVVLSD